MAGRRGQTPVGAVGGRCTRGRRRRRAVVPPALVTTPVRRLAEQAGYLQSVQEICRNVPEDAAVVVAGSYATLVLPESLRAWCGVPVAAMRPDATGEDLFTLAEGWAAECRPLVLVAQDEPTTVTLVNEIGPGRAVVAARNDRLLERVVDGVPSHYQPEALTVTVGVVPVVNSCVDAGCESGHVGRRRQPPALRTMKPKDVAAVAPSFTRMCTSAVRLGVLVAVVRMVRREPEVALQPVPTWRSTRARRASSWRR